MTSRRYLTTTSDPTASEALSTRVDARFWALERANGVHWVTDPEYGATGDGTTDDTATVDGWLAVGGELLIPEGTYLVDYFRPRANSVIRFMKGAVVKARTAGNYLMDITDVDNWEIHDGVFDCDHKVLIGLYPVGCDNWKLIRPEVKNITQPSGGTTTVEGVKLGASNTNWLIEDCYIHDIQGAANTIEGDSTGAARGIGSYHTTDVHSSNGTIRGGRITDIGPREDGDAIALQFDNPTSKTPVNITIEGVTFERCAKRFAKIVAPGVTMRHCYGINGYDGASPGVDDMYAAVSVYASNVTVQHNEFRGGAYRGAMFDVQALSGTLSKIKVTDNRGSCGTGAKAWNGLIYLHGTIEDSEIDRNRLSGADRYGAWIRGGFTRSSFSANHLTGINASYPCVLTETLAAVASSQVRAYDNHVAGGTFGVYFQSGDQIAIRGTRGTTGDTIVRVDAAVTNYTLSDNIGTGTSATVASATTLTIPPTQDVVTVTGTIGITNIVATGNAGRRVTLIFAAALTVTDGGNIKLASNFTTTADDTLTLACDGTNWHEVARSVN